MTALLILHCWFCGSRHAQRTLIQGPMNVCICDDCVDICVEILAKHEAKSDAEQQRSELAVAGDAVDPSVPDPGTPSTREE